MTSSTTWKSFERRVALFFNTLRTPLSGGNSQHTRSDTLHKKLFVEVKYRKLHAVLNLWRETAKLAKLEGKIPLVVLGEKYKKGFWLLFHVDDIAAVEEELKKARNK